MSLTGLDAIARTPPKNSVTRVMGLVLLALLPGALARAWLLGSTDLPSRLLLAIVLALGFEALMLKARARARPLRPFLSDLSAPVSAVLLALLLPPAIPAWQLGLGVLLAIVVAKHWYGGLGENLFNPAMLGYAFVLLCFPNQFDASAGFGPLPAGRETWVAGLYAIGGIFLIARKIIPWQTPLAMLGGTIAGVFGVRLAGGQPPCFAAQEFFSASLMLGAFFVVTDPVTGCLSTRGRVFFGFLAGLLTVLLAAWSGLPDGLPFAVLLMNCAAPWLDRQTRPHRRNAVTRP